MSDDVRRRLEDAGRRPAPAPDPAFAGALEARLRAVASSLPPSSPQPPRRDSGLRWRLAGAGLGLAGVALAVVVWAGGTAPGPAGTPELVEPVNVEVAFVDGTVLEDPDGLLLPEGAVITVGAGGSARIGDMTLGPGDVAVVRDGRLEVQRPGSVASAPQPTATRPPPKPGATAKPPTAPPTASSTVAPSGTRSPAPGVTAAPTPATGRTEPPTAPPTPRPNPSETVVTSPTPTPTPVIVRPRLRARLIVGPRIAVTWTETWSARSYLLLATVSKDGPAADPAYPGARVLGEFASPPERPLRFQVPDGVVEVKLRVIALRGDGTLLRRSRIVTITIPVDTSGGGDGPGPTPSPSPGPSATPSP